MSLMECAHCHRPANDRAMTRCPGCESMICAPCAGEGNCPDGELEEDRPR